MFNVLTHKTELHKELVVSWGTPITKSLLLSGLSNNEFLQYVLFGNVTEVFILHRTALVIGILSLCLFDSHTTVQPQQLS